MTLPFAETDIFRGFFEEDVARIQALRATQPAAPDPSVYIDAIGVKTAPSSCFWIGPHLGKVELDIPLANHPLGQEGIEFAALAMALDWAVAQDSFTVTEIGAGWGPWSSIAATVARSRFSNVGVIAMEADPKRFQMLRGHLDTNNLLRSHTSLGWESPRLLQAAVGTEDGTLYWPADMDPQDAGGATTSDRSLTSDYRGSSIRTVAVTALSLKTALEGVKRVDFMHIDIQGAEYDIIFSSLDTINNKVKCIFIGTHSRKIEGDLIILLRETGWHLIREKPCQFYSMAQAPTLTGLTYHDGSQFWVNPNI